MRSGKQIQGGTWIQKVAGEGKWEKETLLYHPDYGYDSLVSVSVLSGIKE